MKYGSLRRENYKQFSGEINLSSVLYLKEKNYIILPVTPDGDAPKQYIRAYFYYKNCPRKSNPKSWDGYYAKFGSKSYPHESIVEYTINKIGEALSLKMNETRLVIANGQVRFLSKDFITSGKRLIHGTEILAEYYEDKQFVELINKDRKERRKFFTFQEVENAIKYVYEDTAGNILKSLVELITFDAIIGNNDRHFYNWGVIGNITRDQDNPVEFAPVYDSARGLLWNKDEKAIKKLYDQALNDSQVLEAYCKRSRPRFSFEEKPEANHFELISHLAGYSSSYRNIINALVSDEKERLSLQKQKEITGKLFSKERNALMERILTIRFSKLREVV